MTVGNLEVSKDTQATFRQTTGDALLTGLITMLVINVGQRIVGLIRNLGFCHFLPEADLGLWALANSFFLIAAPIAVLGLPGSLGKFVEHYRIQGQLRPYLTQLLIGCAVGVSLFCAGLLAFPESAGRILYGQSLGLSVIIWTVCCLVSLIVFNTVAELAISLRLVRMNSIMHFINTSVFTLAGLLGIVWLKNWIVLLPAYALACILATVPGAWGVWKAAGKELKQSSSLPGRAWWSRILPFAIAVWCVNLMNNLFDLSDRYMLLHLTRAGAEAGQALVGQFYCSRMIPNLLLSLGLMMGGVILPYLSADWEQKRFDRISQSMNNLITMFSLGFTALSVAGLAMSPFLFDGFLAGRYQPAAEILPLGMTLACWSGLGAVATAYMLCAEKGRQNAILTGICLLVNLLLNYPLILWMGLFGAALATTISNGVLLYLILWRLDNDGCSIRKQTYLISCLPVCLSLGPTAVTCLLVALTFVCGRTNWLLTERDRASIDELLIPYCRRVRLPIGSLWPARASTG